MRIRELILIGFLVLFSLMQTGCASFNKKLKGWLNGSSSQSSENKQVSTLTKFSDSPDVEPRVKRQYKRTTKETLANEAALDSKSGSLWVMEGQGAYLFSQNIVRLVGDPLGVTMEGDPKEQLQSKVTVIKKLLAKIEERQKARQRNLASAEEEESGEKDKKEKDKKDKTAQNQQQKKEELPPAGSDAADFNVKTVPTRIIERTLEGNYRVKGSQPVMIGAREYKVIVTGIVRAEDFNEEGISASKLLDPKFDIVSARRKEGEM